MAGVMAMPQTASKATKRTDAEESRTDRPAPGENQTVTEVPEPAQRPYAELFDKAGVPYGTCVVNTPSCVGRAVNGVVCSYHAMHYRWDGTPRSEQ